MSNQNQPDQKSSNKSDTKAMWIASGVIVLLIVGMMGAKMMFGSGNDTTTPSEVSSQSKPAQ